MGGRAVEEASRACHMKQHCEPLPGSFATGIFLVPRTGNILMTKMSGISVGQMLGGLAVWGVIGLAPIAQAQTTIPDNASERSYADGWACNAGFRAEGEECKKIPVPDNAYATDSAYGRGWECHYGFARKDAICTAVTVPTNAYLDSFGTSWSCARGYDSDGSICAKITVPANAHLTDTEYGSGWECEHGYAESRDTCEKIKVPEHGYLSSSAYGERWKCERGYQKSRANCVPVVMPTNAHLNYAGDGWACNRPYEQLGMICEMPAR